MTAEEASLYEESRTSEGISALAQMTIDKIQELRIFCTHPLVYDDAIVNKDPIQTSNKYARLCEIMENIVASGEKAIIFTSFNKMVEILCADLEKRFKVKTSYINGSVPTEMRQRIIDEFSSHLGSAVLVLNPRAAGTGLNITAANHVIHYNLEWNPALEDQASARAYRRGQKKTVFVHRLFYSGTIEEVINDRIQRKRKMSDLAIVGNLGVDDEKADLIRALNMSPLGGD
jgi:SNF2 family DNA or RNA helicase